MKSVAIPFLSAALAMLALPCNGQSDLSDSILTLRFSQLSFTRERSILLQPNLRFQDLDAHEGSSNFPQDPPTANPLEKGSYRLGADPGQPEVVTVTLTSPNFEYSVRLRFVDAVSGVWESNQTTGSSVFRVYPRVVSDDLRNVSNRTWVDGQRLSISGFIVDGQRSRWVLLRAAGPALMTLGVSNAVKAPQAVLYRGSSRYASIFPWNLNRNWADGLSEAFRIVGAFPFAVDSADCARLLLLPPGEYTIHCWADEPAGEILAEVYQLPYGS